MVMQKITRKWLKNHMAYSWWKYLLMATMCVFCVNLLFTVTQYRPPEEKKVEVYVLNSYAQVEAMRQELEPLFFERCPGQEQLQVININLGSDDMYARMQFTTYVAAKQGDVFLIPYQEMKSLAAEGPEVFVDLTPYLESGVIDAKDIDLSAGVMKNAAGEEGVYAIPADSLYGLLQYSNDPAGSCLCLMAYGGNDEHAAQMLNLLIEQYHTEKPQDYEHLRKKQNNQQLLF